jgi:DNA ligase D-like protein (predicted ligase)
VLSATENRDVRTASARGVGAYIKPQLCELVDAPPEGDKWVHEIKLDGYRMQMHVRSGKSTFYSRNGLDWTHRFPEIAKACQALDDVIIDGEVCAVDKEGLPSFAALTDALSSKDTSGLVYFVFDLLYGNGQSLLNEPLQARKKALQSAIRKLKRNDKPRLSFVEHHAGDGAEMLKAACHIKLEGIVSKRVDIPYKPGDRSGVWTKAKCRLSQELVVGGWKMTGAAFRSLVVGVHRGGKFVHAGTVGTGFNSENLPGLMKALKARASDKRPFENPKGPKEGKDIHWVTPTLVIEAAIASWTSDNLIRQASFKGLREDKPAKDVVIEVPVPAPGGKPAQRTQGPMMLEDAKKAIEKTTGIGRPGKDDLPHLIFDRKPTAYRLKDDGKTPNNPLLPLIIYRSAVKLLSAYDPAAVFEELFAKHKWSNSWRDGVYDFLHFHTRTHEVLGIARGSASIEFGGGKGRVIPVKAGDVIILPAGTGHRRKSASRDLLVVGAYPENGGEYDEPHPNEVDGEEARAAIEKVPLPAQDPVYGASGPLRAVWKRS